MSEANFNITDNLAISTTNSGNWGTYTPVVTLSGAGTIPVYSTNAGCYYVVGDVCFCDIYLNGDGGNEGSGTTQIQISLPLAPSNSHLTDLSVNFPVGMAQNGAIQYFLFGSIDASTNRIFLRRQETAVNDTNPFTGDNQNNTSRTVRLHFFYEKA